MAQFAHSLVHAICLVAGLINIGSIVHFLHASMDDIPPACILWVYIATGLRPLGNPKNLGGEWLAIPSSEKRIRYLYTGSYWPPKYVPHKNPGSATGSCESNSKVSWIMQRTLKCRKLRNDTFSLCTF